MTDDSPRIFGIRHHGPGSARSLIRALYDFVPELILVEGPPDANNLIHFLGHPEMIAPIAMLVYVPDEPKLGAFYPFANFSPELQAIRFALENDIPVRFMDLPLKHAMAIKKRELDEAKAKAEAQAKAQEESPEETLIPEDTANEEEAASPEAKIRSDPLGELAKGAGYQDGERWWEHMVENRQNDSEIFTGLLEAMTALREEGIVSNHPTEDLREASMRQIVRQAQKEGYQRIAIVCGAWHSAALVNLENEEADEALLADLPSIAVDATFTPWTHSRLTMWSGYGAGIWSPGWYQHLWESDGHLIGISWLTKVAYLLREEDMSASPAQVIDAVRLSDTLAAIRHRPVAGLEEFNEAAQTVFCFGNPAPLRLIHDKLIVGEVMGSVPDGTPMMPLQLDLRREQKRLELRESPDKSELTLDLRNDFHLERSHLLHRLQILEVPWGEKVSVQKQAGTAKEVWKLQWFPELTIQLIEKSAWGNTILDAGTDFAKHIAKDAKSLPLLTALVNEVLLANLPNAVDMVVRRLEAEASATGDIKELMMALPELADVLAYGNVRQTDAEMVQKVVDGMVTRSCIGLPNECAMLDYGAAQAMFNAILKFHGAIYLLNQPNYETAWHDVLKQLLDHLSVHVLIRGRACRILLDEGKLDIQEAQRQMRLAMSLTGDPSSAAAWLEGFLHNSGLILVHDEALLNIVDDWVMALNNENFEGLLPLLRRTFSSFDTPERRAIGKLISGKAEKEREAKIEIDEERAKAMLPILMELLGMDLED
jgi:hypothetical protein